MKKNKILLNILSVICFIYGACYIFSLVFIPIGVYCFSAGKKFSYKADHLLDNYSVDKKIMRNYTIFVSIVCFPLGLISIIAYFGVYGNNVKVSDFEYHKITEVEPEQTKNSTQDESVELNNEPQETEEEKLEKLKKLEGFRDKNIITEEEFEMAKEQIFGKKEN